MKEHENNQVGERVNVGVWTSLIGKSMQTNITYVHDEILDISKEWRHYRP